MSVYEQSVSELIQCIVACAIQASFYIGLLFRRLLASSECARGALIDQEHVLMPCVSVHLLLTVLLSTLQLFRCARGIDPWIVAALVSGSSVPMVWTSVACVVRRSRPVAVVSHILRALSRGFATSCASPPKSRAAC